MKEKLRGKGEETTTVVDQKGLVGWLKTVMCGMLVMGRRAGPPKELKLAADLHAS